MSYETVPAVDVTTQEKPQPRAERFRHAITYRIDGDLRFISHHDTVRMFQRAVARADLPVKFSEGFNPHSRVQFPLPRPVGIASDEECVLIEFAESIDPQHAMNLLATQMPADITLQSAREAAPGEKFLPNLVRYQLQLDDENREELAARIAHCNAAAALPVSRTDNKQKTKKTIDVRPYLADVSLKDDAVEFTLRVTTTGTARPAEIAELLGISAGPINHRIRRMEIQWL